MEFRCGHSCNLARDVACHLWGKSPLCLKLLCPLLLHNKPIHLLVTNVSPMAVQGFVGAQRYYSKHRERPGKKLREAGLRPKHPAVVVPGRTAVNLAA